MIFIYILLSITFVYLLVTFIIYRVIFYRCDKPSKLVKINYTCEQRKVMNDVKKEIYEKYKLSHEDVFVESFDNLKLFGKLYVLDETRQHRALEACRAADRLASGRLSDHCRGGCRSSVSAA